MYLGSRLEKTGEALKIVMSCRKFDKETKRVMRGVVVPTVHCGAETEEAKPEKMWNCGSNLNGVVGKMEGRIDSLVFGRFGHTVRMMIVWWKL